MIYQLIYHMSYNLLELYQSGLPNVDKEETKLSKKLELKKKLPAPESSELQLIVVTCHVPLNMNLNLNLIGRLLMIDDEILGVKLLNVCSRGQVKSKTARDPTYKTRVKKDGTKKPDPKKRKDFSNQCTIVVKPKGSDRQLNLKVFGNGKIVITGGLTKQEAYQAVDILRTKIRYLEDDYQIIKNTQFKTYFDCTAKYIKYITKYYLIFLKLFSLHGINIDLKLDLLLNKKKIKKYPIINKISNKSIETDLNDIDIYELITNKILLSAKDEKDLVDFLRMIQVFDICHHYFTDKDMATKLDDPKDDIHKLITGLYNFDKVRLPVTFNLAEFDRSFDVTIQNYNTIFMCNYHIDRKRFTEILNTTYKNKICSAKFEPTTYQGINTKYISRICCPNKDMCTSQGKKKVSICPCKEVSFLIFQEGKIIITGGRKWEQIMEGYNVITQILKDEYYNVMIENRVVISDIQNNLPAQINKQNKDGTQTIYLNKLQQITENPRNFYLLKKMGILEKYI